MRRSTYFCLSLVFLIVVGQGVFAPEIIDPFTGKIISGEAISDYSFEYAKDSIKQKAIDVSKQIEIYLRSHPEKTIEDLQNDEYFQEIAVQQVGKTGYTAVTDYDNLVAKFHKNPDIVEMPLENLAEKLPGFWEVMSRTRGGFVSEGVYDWAEKDGSINQKYMYISIVNVKTADGAGVHVAATTYLEEYAEEEKENGETFSEKLGLYLPWIILGIIILLAGGIIVWAKSRERELERNRILLIAGIFIILIAALFSTGAYLMTTGIRQSALESFIQERTTIAENKVDEINTNFIGLEDHLRYMSQKSIPLDIVSPEMDALLKMNYEMSGDSAYAAYRINGEGVIENMYPVDSNSIGFNISYQEHMVEVVETMLPVISGVFYAVEGFEGITLHDPVIVDGRYEGTVAFLIDLDSFFSFVRSLRNVKDNEIYILDQNDKIVYESSGGAGSLHVNTSEVGELNEVLKSSEASRSSLFEYGGSEKIAIGVPLEFRGKIWHLLLISDTSVVYQGVESKLNWIVLITVVTIVLIIILAMFLYYQLTRSLRKEVGEKTVQLQEFNKKLEKTVLERTRELDKKSQELGKLNLGLGKEVTKRTKELDFKIEDLKSTKRALMNMMEDTDKANEKLKKLDKSKSEFLNIVSHELKTPLTAIIAYLDVLADARKNPNPEEVESLEAIARNSRSLKRLIGNILEIARMESGKFELIKQKTNIKETVIETLKDIKSIADKKGIKLVNNLGEIPTMMLDAERFREIIINLTGNAIKFTEKGSITISGEVKDKFVEFQIADTGVGIPENHIKELFNKFYQVDASISRKYGGTGLGLAITKKIIEAHGGKIEVSSIQGKGTTFKFLLPIKDVKVPRKKIKGKVNK